MPWRALDHTADAALEVSAGTWPALLEEAALAFGQWITDGHLPGGAHETERAFELGPFAPLDPLDPLDNGDRVPTWVGFWRALHRLWTVEGFLPVHARVALVDTTAGALVRVRAGCISAGALDLAHVLDVKAVTWHAAAVTERDGRWTGVIVLDL